MATDKIQKAFVNDTALATRVTNAYIRCQNDPELSQVFIDIAAYISQQRAPPTLVSRPDSLTKKRKLDIDEPSSDAINDAVASYEARDVSFSAPARKKLRLDLIVSAANQKQGEIRLIDDKTEEVEYTMALSDIEQTLCLPQPDKLQKQQNYVVIPRDGTKEQIVFTVNMGPDKTGSIKQRSTQKQDGETLVDVTSQELTAFLSRSGKKLILPDPQEFASTIPQTHRKGEKAYHVKAFRGSKDGYLFFLSNGIFFGFKKPLVFFTFAGIASISYTSVLQRTFNLVVTPFVEGDEEPDDVEFSMLDQADFPGIDEYVKLHGLNDASMAADRRAKMYNVNKDKPVETNGETQAETEPDDGLTELQRAEQALQDAEDELESDFDPEGGSSDGEGESSEEEDQGNDYEERDADEDAEEAEADEDDDDL